MKTIRIALLTGLVAMSLSSAWAGENEAVKKEMVRLQGNWSMVSGTLDGRPLPTGIVKQMKRDCKADEVTTTMGGQLYFKAKISIDASKQPKTIDYEMIEGSTKGKKQLGIYEVDGGTFKSSFGKPGAERPADFTSSPGDGRTLTVWKREKSAQSAPEQNNLRR